ncbi:cadmium resistance transporter (or sequestration) family protein [Clostridium cavendishii DSM 21758]|uniref:Cadmium resistance transporter (Or sequestration) family protein n=1 Tax=Clostridium cavendishii DSM 21758 TaxID=1121302 RepID=A0A1M6RX10_9CLOT|nr:cadmium resistance transporter [Clostridium cavendishii]SHK37032.1 cadmium resistance transporter (or sequestration) family protein [Clostridium cavendishii DSM 21758]
MIGTLITAFIAFVSTNIDDIVVLILLFSQADSDIKKRNIIIGQYLGVAILIIISIIGALGVASINSRYVGFLGLVPIYLGIKTYIDYKRKKTNDVNLSYRDIKENVDEEKETDKFTKNQVSTGILAVATLTIAGGGDNIGIYIPLFVCKSLIEILIMLIVFIILVALWCLLAIKLTGKLFIQKSIDRYSHILVPIIFIGLGFFIIIKSI